MGSPTPEPGSPARGIRDPRTFWLLVLTNGFVGTMVGVERTIVPILGEQVFGVASRLAIISFIATFGIAKAFSNLFAGAWSDRVGRKRVLTAGWLVGIPVPLILMFAPAPHWWLILLANVLLGVNQGLCWSMTVVMKVDLAGPDRRGFAIGLNEFAGYFAVSVAAFASGYVASTYALRPWPFLIGLVAAVAGLLVSALLLVETGPKPIAGGKPAPADGTFWRLSWGDRNLASLNQAGLVKNLNDGVAWGLLPILFAAFLNDPASVGILAAAYPLAWSVGQLATGPFSDSRGRKALIVGGMLIQGVALIALTLYSGLLGWLGLMVLFGAGTAMVYPTLMGAVGDSTRDSERATGLGVYRFWRDLGFAIGALGGGALADLAGLGAAVGVVGAVTLVSGLVVAFGYLEMRRPGAAGRTSGDEAS